MSPEPHNSVEVFYSYAHEDEKLRDELKKHLQNLKRQGVITDWYDRDISAGKEWNEEIELHLNSAKVILLLVSPDFMNSDYINDVEVKRAMERHEAGEAQVIPVILRPVDWQGAKFSKLQSLPTDVRAVTLWANRDEAFVDVTTGIRAALKELSNPLVEISAGLDIPSPPKVGFVPRRDRDNRDIVERLHNELSPRVNQLVVLWGAGGVGKTAIAAEAVRGLIEPFGRRIAWVSAEGLENFSLATLLDGIATQLGHPDLRKLAIDLKKEQVRDLVKTVPTLVVLDNFETIEPAERAHCVDWLGNPAPCSALITTRDVIEDARNIPIDVMRSEEANDLLDQLIAQTHEARAFAILDRDRLIRTAEANPLVLQWIVGQIDLAQDPDEVLDDLQHGEGKAADRVFNRSFELKQLNNGGRAVLLALSLFAPSATRKAVAEVSGFGKDSDKKKFRDAVRSLSALWLIHTTDEGTRLAVEGLTRQLTRARLDMDPRSKPFRQRFVSRFLRFTEVHAQPLRDDYDLLELEKDNLVAAANLAFIQGDLKSTHRFAYVLALPVGGMLCVRGYWDDSILVGGLALKIACSSEIEVEIASWSHNMAVMYQDPGELTQARKLYDESLRIKKKLGDQLTIAHTLHQLGTLEREEGNVDKAEILYNESLDIYRKLGDEAHFANTLHNLAVVTQDRGEFEKARRLYDQALQIHRKFDSELNVAIGLHQLGTLHRAEGNYQSAAELLGDSLAILRNLGDKQYRAECLESIGNLKVAMGTLEEAHPLLDEALAIAENVGIPFRIASVKQSLGLLWEAHGEIERAIKYLREALVSFEKLHSPKAEDTRQDLERIEGKPS